MKLQDIFFSPFMNKFALWLGEHISPKVGYWITEKFGTFIASRKKTEQVRAVRSNQWVVSGKTLSSEALDRRVKQVYINSSRSMYDYYHSMQKPDRILQKIEFDESFNQFMALSKQKKNGLLGLILHMGSFDLAGYAMALNDMHPLILSYPSPNEAYQWQNELRRRSGLNVTPLSMQSLSRAARFLKEGGTVITGIDRPWRDLNHNPQFFGEPSDIPVTMIQLALKTQVPISIIACIRIETQRRYCLFASPLIEMVSYEDRDEELTVNAEAVLKVAEEYLKKAPEQWAMFYPVWPQVLNETP
jgi:KDO2-lipid IV(A) lauroyltransferase